MFPSRFPRNYNERYEGSKHWPTVNSALVIIIYKSLTICNHHKSCCEVVSRRGRQIHLYVPNSLLLNNDPLLLPLTWRQNFQIYKAANKLHMSSSWICDCIISIYTIGSFIWNVILTSSAIAECKWFTWNERKFNNSWLVRVWFIQLKHN